MISTRIACSLITAITLLASSPSIASSTSDQLNQKGWTALWNNNFTEARTDFTSAVKADPSSANSYFGLTILENEEDKPNLKAAHTIALYKSAPSSRAAAFDWNFAKQIGNNRIIVAAAKALLANKNCSAEMRADAAICLADAEDALGSPDPKAKATRSALGFIKDWRIIGPFSNAAKSGFDKPYSPEKRIEFAKPLTGENGCQYSWMPLKAISPSGYASIFDALSTSDDAEVFYAATAVYVPAETSATLYMNTEGASKVFVNGAAALIDNIYRQKVSSGNGSGSLKSKVRLTAGWNVILVKLATDSEVTTLGKDDDSSSQQSGASTAAFRLRLVGNGGAPLILKADASKAEGGSASEEASNQKPETVFGADLPAGQTDPVGDLIFVAENQYASGDFDGAEQTIKDAVALHPTSSILKMFLAKYYEDDDQDDEAKQAINEAVQQNPGDLTARLWKIMYGDVHGNSQDTIAQYQAALKLNPSSPLTLRQLSKTYADAKLTANAIATAKKAYAIQSDTKGLTEYADSLMELGRRSDAQKAIAAALKQAPNDPVILATAAYADDESNSSSEIQYCRKMLQLDPADFKSEEMLAQSLANTGATDKALKAWRNVLNLLPQNVNALVSTADLLVEKGSKGEAITLYKKALSLDLSQVDLREKIAILSGSKPEIDKVAAITQAPLLAEAAKATASDYPGESGVTILDEMREVVYPDGGSLARVHRIVKLFDKASADRFSSVRLHESSFNSSATVELAKIIKADGKVQDCSKDSYSTIEFPSLSPGDTIEYSYRVTDYASGELAGRFWGSWDLNTDLPVKHSHFALIVPKTKPYQIRLNNGAPEPTKRDDGDWTIAEWRGDNIAPLHYEAAAPPLRDILQSVDYSSIPDWKTIVNWYIDLSVNRCEPDSAVRQKALDLTKNASNETDKIKALVSYVRSITYQSSPFRLSPYVPTEGKKVMRDQYGDCKDKASLLTALLGAIGVKSEMVLLTPRNEGVLPYLPSPHFAHAIARVQTAAGPLFVDATADNLAFGAFPGPDEQAPCLLIDPQTTDLTLTPDVSPKTEQTTISIDAALAESGDITANLTMNSTGWIASILKSAFMTSSKDELNQRLLAFISYLVPNAIYDEGSVEGVKDPDAPVIMKIKYHVSHFASDAGDFIVVPSLYPNSAGAIAALKGAKENRKLDLDLSEGRSVGRIEISLTLPAKLKPQKILEPDTVKNQWFNWSTTESFDGKALYLTHLNGISAIRIPASDVKAAIESLEKSEQYMSQPIILQKEPETKK